MSFLDFTQATLPAYSPGSGAPGDQTYQRLSGATTTEASNSRRFLKGKLHKIVVGATPVRIEFRGEAGLGTQVDRATSYRLPANSVHYFVPSLVRKEDGSVAYGSIHMYVSDDSGSAGTYEVFVSRAGV